MLSQRCCCCDVIAFGLWFNVNDKLCERNRTYEIHSCVCVCVSFIRFDWNGKSVIRRKQSDRRRRRRRRHVVRHVRASLLAAHAAHDTAICMSAIMPRDLEHRAISRAEMSTHYVAFTDHESHRATKQHARERKTIRSGKLCSIWSTYTMLYHHLFASFFITILMHLSIDDSGSRLSSKFNFQFSISNGQCLNPECRFILFTTIYNSYYYYYCFIAHDIDGVRWRRCVPVPT